MGILGGTFDPVHCGHLRLAIEIRERLGLDAVRLMPAPNPRLRRRAPVAGARARLAMLEAAVRDVPGLEVDARELDRSGPTYTVESLVSLRHDLPDAALCLILGMDVFRRLTDWHRWRELLELSHLAVVDRPGSRAPRDGPLADLLDRHGTEDAADLRRRPHGRVHRCRKVPVLDISATDIRRRLAEGRSVHCLVPRAVHERLLRDGLYAEAS